MIFGGEAVHISARITSHKSEALATLTLNVLEMSANVSAGMNGTRKRNKELSASFVRVTRIGELGTILAVTSNRRTLRRNTKSSSETSVLTRVARRNIPEETILHSHRRENLKSYRNKYEEWCLLGCYAVGLL
jgi:hypothetical protein